MKARARPSGGGPQRAVTCALKELEVLQMLRRLGRVNHVDFGIKLYAAPIPYEDMMRHVVACGLVRRTQEGEGKAGIWYELTEGKHAATPRQRRRRAK